MYNGRILKQRRTMEAKIEKLKKEIEAMYNDMMHTLYAQYNDDILTADIIRQYVLHFFAQHITNKNVEYIINANEKIKQLNEIKNILKKKKE